MLNRNSTGEIKQVKQNRGRGKDCDVYWCKSVPGVVPICHEMYSDIHSWNI